MKERKERRGEGARGEGGEKIGGALGEMLVVVNRTRATMTRRPPRKKTKTTPRDQRSL